MYRYGLVLPLAAAASIALAQTHDHHSHAASPGGARDPANAAERVPAARYESPFAGYRRQREEPVGSWRDANDTVGRIGGWRAYAREAADAARDAQKPAPAHRHEHAK
jgi:hypothetical protein